MNFYLYPHCSSLVFCACLHVLTEDNSEAWASTNVASSHMITVSKVVTPERLRMSI